MGWLEQVKQTRADLVSAQRASVQPNGERRFGLSQLMEMFSYAGVGYSVYGGDHDNVERNSTWFQHYVQSYYKDNGVIFAVILARILLFTEARFQWQRMIKGRPGDLFGTAELELLENPWPNGTTGDLLARMEQDASLHGNFYAVKESNRLRRLRPDWVEIVLDAPPAESVSSNIKGFLFRPGGPDSRTEPKVYLPHEVAHWAPIPDPMAQYRGMSWISTVIREISGDRAASDHKLKFFENAATPNLAVSFSENITKDQFNAFMAAMNASHQGTDNAYKTLYLGGGADVKTIGANMEQMDFKATQGAGEALALDTPIPTPDGWTTMGDLQPGDQVLGRDGQATVVLAISPVHVDREVYRVTFNDRTSIMADAAHIWQATDHGTSLRNERLYTTQQLAKLMSGSYRNGGNGYGGGYRIGVPLSPVVELPNVELPIDPYFLGVWLGDGNSRDATFSMGRHEFDHFEREFKDRGFHLHSRYQDTRCATDVVRFNHDDFKVRPVLRSMGLLDNKHVPDMYLRAGTSQRVELVRGLMDSDGYVDKRGRCEFSTKWAHLAGQVAELLRSLGQRVTVSVKKEPRSVTGETWRVSFRGDPRINPFCMGRKAERVRTAGVSRVARRSIVSIERVDSVPVKCIAVDAPDKLYLAGQGFVPTHNTRICAAGGVPPIIVGLSEGLQSATYSNYGMARRKFGDHWARPQWRSACAALSTLVKVPRNARLWYDDRDIAFLREDQKDVAAIQTQQASTIKQLGDAGYKPESIVAAITNEDWTLLEHTGLFSVQLQPPGAGVAPDAQPGPAELDIPDESGQPDDAEPGAGLTEDDNTKADGVIPASAITSEQNSVGHKLDELRELISGLSEQVASAARAQPVAHFELVSDVEPRAWDEALHPRAPAGEGGGGQFMSYDEKKNQGTGYGKKGGDADVRKLQEALNKLGLTDSHGKKLDVDGMLGPLTTSAVMKAQKMLGVKPDGKVSPTLLKKILTMKKPSAKPTKPGPGHGKTPKKKPASHRPKTKPKPKTAPKAAPKAKPKEQPRKPGEPLQPKYFYDNGTKLEVEPENPEDKPKIKPAGAGKVGGGHRPKPKGKKKHKAKVVKYFHQSSEGGSRSSNPEANDVEEPRAWEEHEHPRGPGGKFAEHPGSDAHAADLFSDTMEGMRLVKSAINNKRSGRAWYENDDGSDERQGDDYYLLGEHRGNTNGLDSEIEAAAAVIDQRVRNAPTVSTPLSRGMRIKQWDLPEPGDEFDAGGRSGVSSWTSDPNRADRYSAPGDIFEDGRRVRLVTDGPVAAYDLGKQKRHSRTGDDGEHLIGNGQRVRVISIEKLGDGPKAIYEIKVRLVGNES